MADFVVDTNVLLVASACPGSGGQLFRDCHIDDPTEVEKVFDRVSEFHGSEDRMVLDIKWLIAGEYQNKLDDQHYGSRVWMDKYQSARLVDIEVDDHGDAELPEPLVSVVHDRADRKMVAAALQVHAEGDACSIVNACDTDWYEWEDALEAAGVPVCQLIDPWCRAEYERKKNR